MLKKLFLSKQVLIMLASYLFLSLAGCFMVLVRILFTGQLTDGYLIWNLFLTWVPLIVAVLLIFIYSHFPHGSARTCIMMFLGLIWVAFYPNAPYIITDFIHLNEIQTFFVNQRNLINFIGWYDFVMTSLFILTGFLLGFVSLFMIQKLIRNLLNKILSWFFVAGMLFLSSFGIYLGRFIRWNSWDLVTNPVALMDSILESFHRYAFAFTLTFGLFLILIYIALYNLTKLSDQKIGLDKTESF